VNETVVEDEAAEIGGGEPNHYVNVRKAMRKKWAKIWL
jgi:hypothetical protein